MNKNSHRIVFNAQRGLRMAVAETATAQGKNASGEGRNRHVARADIPPLVIKSAALGVAALGLLLWTQSPARAQIVVDPSAPASQRPTVLQTANGLPQVNLQTPSAAGVSRNTYSQFDVQRNGAVLNNSRTDVQTQLGGWVQGNPSLATGSARVILNEVNSVNPSQLKGYVEVAGQRAEVVIANPAGINVDGGGFINASSVTLTTGTPVMNGGNLDGYRVQSGSVSVSGQGLDASAADYTGILARAVQVNAGIWAQELKVLTGANQIDAVQTIATPITGTGAAPAFALDVAQLGGMYADKIHLIGTEAGMGMRNAGVMGATAGDVVLQSNGWLTSSGLIATQGNASLSGTQVNLANGQISAQNISLNASAGDVDASRAILSARGTLSASAAQTLRTDGAAVAAYQLNLTAHDLSNVGGEIFQTGAGDAAMELAGNLNNSQGRIAGNSQNLTLGANTLTNTGGTLETSGNATIRAGSLNNTQGLVRSGQTTTLIASTVTNSNTSGANQGIEGQNVAITAATIANDAGAIRADNNATLTSSAGITNTGGTVIAGQSAVITAASLSGDGKVLSKGDLSISLTTDFNNTSSGEVIANNNATVNTSGNLNNSGKLEAGAMLVVSAVNLTNRATLVGASVTLQASQRVLNLGPQAFIGASASTGVLQMLAPEIINRDDTTATDTAAQTSIVGLGTVVLAGGIDGAGNYTAANTVRNESGYISSGADMTIHADTLTNTRRVLQTSDTYAPTGQTVQGQVVWTPSNPDVPGGRYIEPPHGGSMNSDYLYTDYQGTIARNSITQISPKGVIEAGGNLNPVVTRLQNYWSAVTAAGNIALNGVTLDQNGWQNGNSANPGVAITPYGESAIYSGTYVYRTYSGGIWTNSWGPTSPVVTPLGGFDASLTAAGSISGSGNTLINTTGVNPNTPLGTQSGVPPPASIVSLLPGFSLPMGGLYYTNPNPSSRYLVETNAVFTNNKQWLSSDYYFEQLGLDPAVTQKRLGDGYYEQQLIKEQLIGLTGRAVLDYPDAQSQYRALMQAGAQYARQLQLAPGIGLSADQVAQLSQDVVILQTTTVNGQAVLVPVVYLAPNRAALLLPSGPLIAANNIDLTNSQSIANSGTIRAQQGLSLAAQSIDNRGGKLQSGGLMQLSSRNDIDLTSATLKAGSLNLDAGKNIILNTDARQVTSSVQGGTRVSTQLGQIASIDVQGDAQIKTGANLEQNAANLTIGGNLQTNIGGNWTLGAVQSTETTQAQTASGHANTQVVQQRTSSLKVGGQGDLQVANDFTAQGAAITLQGPATLHVGGNLTLSAVKDSISVDSASASSDHKESTQSFNQTVRGSTLQAGNNLSLTSGQDLTLSASSINVAQGTAQIQAAGNVKIETDTERHQSDSQHTGTHAGLLSSTSTADHNTIDRSDNIGSTISATSVNVVAGKDINVKGASVVADQATTLMAGRDVTIEAARNTLSQSSFHEETQSGLFSSGGLSLTLGQQAQSTDAKNQSTTAAASTVGSVTGKVTILAGNNYSQTGSDVMTPGGDINILAKTVNIQEARETGHSQSEQQFSQSGLTVAITAPVLSALQSAAATAQATRQTKDRRMQALGAASAALSAKSAIDGIASASAAMGAGKGVGAAAGINVSVSIGASSSQSNSVQTSSTAAGSTVQAGGNVKLSATGGGQDSNLLLQGSSVKGNNVNLMADNQIELLAAANTAEQHSTDQNSSASVGIGFAFGGSRSGFTLNANASGGRGNADGRDLGYTNTQVQAGKQLTLQSGGDTHLKGAVTSGKQVVADVGGNLNIESLQDTSTYVSKQSSAGVGVSLCLPPFCYGASSGSVSTSKSNANSNFASVAEQSGIKAGDGGFQVNVKGQTDLKGGAITSTQAGVDQNKNTLTTASLTQSDIQNKADASASSSGIDLSTDMLSQGKYGLAKAVLGNALNNAGESGRASGQTRSAVSAGTVTITDDGKQQQLTGKTGQETVASLNRDTVNAQTAAQKQDVQAMQQTVEAERVIKQAVVAEAVKFSDEAYRKIFIEKHPMYEVVKDKDGNTQFDEKTGKPILRELSEQEKTNLQSSPDGKVHISTNGIFNDKDAAGTYANQHSNTSGPQYVIYFPEANNVVSELMVAGYQKFLENDFMGLSNSTVQVKDAMTQYGQTGLQLDGHSRGAMTIGNGLESKANDPAASGSLSATTINFFGPAYNAQQADNLLSTLQDRPSLPESQQPGAILQLQNHAADPVGGLIGGNPSTGGIIPEGSSTTREAFRAATGQTETVHNCYKSTADACAQFWRDSANGISQFQPVKPLKAQP